MPAQFAGQFGPEDLRQQNATTKNLDMPTSVEIKNLVGSAGDATLYTDRTKASAATNPVTIGVAEGSPGVSVNGNLLAFAAAGRYGLYINGTYVGIITFHPDPADTTSRLDQLEAAAFTTLLNS